MLTLAELEKITPDHIKYTIKRRVQAMSDKQAKERCVELGKKIDIPQVPPPESEPYDLNEHYEYALLKERLGEDCSKRAD